MGFPYRFRKLLGNVGVGVENLGFEQPQTLPLYDGFHNRRYAVRGQLDPQQPAFVKEGQQFVPVALVGNGTQLAGRMALQALAQLTEGGK